MYGCVRQHLRVPCQVSLLSSAVLEIYRGPDTIRLFSPDGFVSDDSLDYLPTDAGNRLYRSPVRTGIYAPRIDPIPLPLVTDADSVGERVLFERHFVPSSSARRRGAHRDLASYSLDFHGPI